MYAMIPVLLLIFGVGVSSSLANDVIPTTDALADVNEELENYMINHCPNKESPAELQYKLGFADAKGVLLPKILGLLNRVELAREEIRKYKSITWKVVPRVFFDDEEAKYKPQYTKFKQQQKEAEKLHKAEHDKLKTTSKPTHVPLYTTSIDNADPCDPKAMRIQKKKELWDWITSHKTDQDDVKLILKKMQEKFRSMQPIPISNDAELTDEQKKEFEKFRKKSCLAIATAYEAASFIIHGNQALELFEGELEELQVYGSEIDPYLVPVINALVPLVKKGVEPATFVKKEE